MLPSHLILNWEQHSNQLKQRIDYKYMKKLILITLLLFGYSLNSYADNPVFIDFAKVLNTSKPGSEAQKKLKNKFKKETEKFAKLEEGVRKEESEIISQKKALSQEEYQKKVQELRKKVSNLQKNKQETFNKIAKSRSNARQSLLKSINPIVKKYMEDNKIRIVFDKQGVILGDSTLEITSQIISIVNKEVSSIKID